MGTERADLGFGGALAEGERAISARRARVDEAIRSFQRGIDREQSFRLLFESYYRPLLRFFGRKGFAPEESLDLTQETLLGIYKGLDGFRREAPFESWLYRVATTTYQKRLRDGQRDKRRGREVAHEDVVSTEPALATQPGQLDGVIHQERRRRVREVVRELPPQMRRCLTLRVYHEMSYRDIASIAGIEIDTVKAHLFQARQRLREIVHLDPLEKLPE